jgi:hypothetical protein
VFSCATSSVEIRHQYRATQFATIFRREVLAMLKILDISNAPPGELFCTCSDAKSVFMCLKERSLTKKHSISIL